MLIWVKTLYKGHHQQNTKVAGSKERVKTWSRGFKIMIIAKIVKIISSPEPLGSQGELIVYPSSWRPSVVRRFQRSSSLKPLGQSKSKFMWSILGKGESKFI